MSYLKLSLPIHETQFERIDELLMQAGALSVTLEDAEDVPILEPGVGETPLWSHLKISALFPHNVNQKKLLNKLRLHCNPELLEFVQWEEVQDEAWELKWLDYFQPISFGRTLWIGTHQHKPDQDYAALIYLEPGLAFGTGTHPSTYLCLEWIANHDVRDKVVLDYGCGSGILALAAAKLGARQVWCVDNDPQALTATKNNAELNGVAAKISVVLPQDFKGVVADILIANILANPLVELAPRFLEFLKPQGEIVLAGILTTQEAQVQAAYASKIAWQETVYHEEWLRLHGVKS